MHIEHNYAKTKCQKEPKTRFLVIILSLVGWIGLILHILIEEKEPYLLIRNQGFRNPLNLCIIVTIRHKRAKNEDFGHCYQVNRLSSGTICMNVMEPMLQGLVKC